jgi:hypothetical protein
MWTRQLLGRLAMRDGNPLCCGMSISDKVVPFENKKSQIVASDTKAQRVIIAIGGERLAIDRFTRITRLRMGTGDEPGTMIPMKPTLEKTKPER